jgi:hypothetical protein
LYWTILSGISFIRYIYDLTYKTVGGKVGPIWQQVQMGSKVGIQDDTKRVHRRDGWVEMLISTSREIVSVEDRCTLPQAGTLGSEPVQRPTGTMIPLKDDNGRLG